MARMTIDDPDEYKSDVPVDSRGRVTVGAEYAGKQVRVAVEVIEE